VTRDTDSPNRDVDPSEPGEYCRQVEAYLCRKNDGHLIRIAGPSFTRVCGWAEQGIPLNAVYRGIDRYCERYYAKGARRRPVHIDFCEHDVLDVFDEWRRAVGVFNAAPVSDREPAPSVDAGPGTHAPDAWTPAPRVENRSSDRRIADRQSLPAHLQRVLTRLTIMRAGGRLSPDAHAAVDAAVREIDLMRPPAVHARGEARAALTTRLAALDANLAAVLRESIGDAEWRALMDEARGELSRFKSGMPADAFEQAVIAAATRLLRERFGLPETRFED
jgi:hypothetical protein